MMEFLEVATGVILAGEVLVALWLSWANWREVQFLRRVRPLLPSDEDLPLFDALDGRAKYITVVSLYLIVLTALGAAGITLADYFPPIRALTAGLLIGLLAGPKIIGTALRRRVRAAQAASE